MHGRAIAQSRMLELARDIARQEAQAHVAPVQARVCAVEAVAPSADTKARDELKALLGVLQDAKPDDWQAATVKVLTALIEILLREQLGARG